MRGRSILRFLLCVLAFAVLGAQDSPGRFGFHTFPPSPGQHLGTASRPVPNGSGGFWFLNQGAIWLFDAGGYRPLDASDGIPSGAIGPVFPEPSTGLWFRAGTTWCRLGRAGLKLLPGLPAPDPARSFLPMRNEGFGVVSDGVLTIHGTGAPVILPSPGPGTWVKGWKAPRGDERLLVGDSGLAIWNGTSWRIEPLRGFLEGRPWDVQRDNRGALWVRSDRDLVRVQPTRSRFGPRLGFTRNSFVSLEEDAFGRMWTNGPEGLACIDGDLVTRITEREGLYGHHAYWPIVFDGQGSLWTISADGFQRMKGGFLWCVEERPQGLPRAMAFTVTRLGDGRLYAGTHDGLYRQDKGPWGLVPGTDGWALFSLAERPGGEIWTCGNPPWASDTAVLCIPRNGTAAKPRIEGFPTGSWALTLLWTGPDELLCGTMKGFFRITPKGDGFLAERIVLPGADPAMLVDFLARTPDGTLWATSPKGLFHRSGGAWQPMGTAQGLAADDVAGAFQGPNGEFWILHDDSNAITRLARDASGWKVVGTFGKDHPLTAQGASGGWTDPKGVVWLTSGYSVVRWDGKRAEHHTRASGLPVDQFFGNSVYGEPDGSLHIGTISGLLRFTPRFYRPVADPPALSGFQAQDGEGRPLSSGAVVPARTKGVAFDLRLPLVEGVEDLRVETRLVGLDDRWRPLEGGTLRFPGLGAGVYRLEARAARQDGLLGPTLSFPFRILRPWYLRTWGLLLWAALTLGLALAAARWRTAALTRDRLRLEGLVDLRTSELLLANAELTQAMGEVRTLSGLVPICCYCKKIRDDDGFWNQLERYIQEHSHAQFSHGICPDCERQARADLARDGVLPRKTEG